MGEEGAEANKLLKGTVGCNGVEDMEEEGEEAAGEEGGGEEGETGGR